VPNASLTVTNKATNVTQKIISNESGGYVAPALNPGMYDISATAAGFRTTVRSGVEMLVGKDLLPDMDLTLGENITVVEVNSEAPLLNSESGSLGHVMTNNQIVDLPLNGRGFNELARLTPGVVLLPGTGNVTRRPVFFNGTTISGVRGRQVSYYLDGTDTSEQHQGGSWIQTSVDALQEFSISRTPTRPSIAGRAASSTQLRSPARTAFAERYTNFCETKRWMRATSSEAAATC
jgi:hypothetical protein